MALETLLKEALGTSEEILSAVIVYLRELKNKKKKKKVSNRKKLYGIFKNQIVISDDFDAPMDDFKEYM